MSDSEPPVFVELPGDRPRRDRGGQLLEPPEPPPTIMAPPVQAPPAEVPPPVLTPPPAPPTPPSEPPFIEPEPGPPSGGPPEVWDEKRMTLVEHLEELRRVLIVSLVAWVLASIVGVALSGYIIGILVKPLDYLHLHLSYFSPFGYFGIHLKVGMVAGLALALPVILQQVWGFVKPGLKPRERRLAGPLLASSLGLFVLGAGLAYFFLYIAVRIIGAVSHDPSLVFFPEANAYLGFVIILMLAFAVTFEFPVVLVLLSLVGLISSAKLKGWRRGAYFIIAAIGYAITPGVDPVTPLALILPLLLLYEAALQVIKRMGR